MFTPGPDHQNNIPGFAPAPPTGPEAGYPQAGHVPQPVPPSAFQGVQAGFPAGVQIQPHPAAGQAPPPATPFQAGPLPGSAPGYPQAGTYPPQPPTSYQTPPQNPYAQTPSYAVPPIASRQVPVHLPPGYPQPQPQFAQQPTPGYPQQPFVPQPAPQPVPPGYGQQPPAQPEQWTGVRQQLSELGYGQLAQQFQSDETAFQWLLQEARRAQDLERLAQYQAGNNRGLPQPQNQPAQNEPWWKQFWQAPEYNPAWEQLIEVDPLTKQVRPKPGAAPDLVQRIQQYRHFEEDQFKKFLGNPFAYIEEPVKTLVKPLISQEIQSAVQQIRDRSQAEHILAENSRWIFDQAGQISPLGQLYSQHMQRLQQQGVPLGDRHQYSMQAVQLAAIQHAPQQHPQPGQTPVQLQQSPNGQPNNQQQHRQDQFLWRSQVPAAQPQPPAPYAPYPPQQTHTPQPGLGYGYQPPQNGAMRYDPTTGQNIPVGPDPTDFRALTRAAFAANGLIPAA